MNSLMDYANYDITQKYLEDRLNEEPEEYKGYGDLLADAVDESHSPVTAINTGLAMMNDAKLHKTLGQVGKFASKGYDAFNVARANGAPIMKAITSAHRPIQTLPLALWGSANMLFKNSMRGAEYPFLFSLAANGGNALYDAFKGKKDSEYFDRTKDSAINLAMVKMLDDTATKRTYPMVGEIVNKVFPQASKEYVAKVAPKLLTGGAAARYAKYMDDKKEENDYGE